jgi:hypothetical protein
MEILQKIFETPATYIFIAYWVTFAAFMIPQKKDVS